uniref:hypothetical protein n=1 Tax=Algoriphagus sp. TaxID=1872435 RepID=UPI00404815F3
FIAIEWVYFGSRLFQKFGKTANFSAASFVNRGSHHKKAMRRGVWLFLFLKGFNAVAFIELRI